MFREADALILYRDFDTPDADAPDGIALSANSPLRFTEGRFGRALLSDKKTDGGEPRYRLPTPLAPDRDWTIALWAKAAGDTFASADHSVVDHLFRTDGGAWGQGNITASIHRNRLHFARFDANGHRRAATCSMAGRPGGVWTHFAFVHRDRTISIFIDGVEAGLAGEPTLEKPGRSQTMFSVGSGGRPGNRFNGALDEIKIFDRALNVAQVQYIMTSQPGSGPRNDPILRIPLDREGDAHTSDRTPRQTTRHVVFKPGHQGKAAEFRRYGYDRGARMEVADVHGADASDLSVAFYFRPFTVSADAADAPRGLVGAVNAMGGGWRVVLDKGRLRFESGNGATAASVDAPFPTVDAFVPVMAVRNAEAGTMALYIGGQRAAAGPYAAAAHAPAATVVIGDLPEGDTYSRTQAEGLLDDLLLFDMALTPEALAEVTARYASPENEVDTLASWTVAPRPASAEEQKQWAFEGADRFTTATRDAVTLNALWRIQLLAKGEAPDADRWRYLAVPGQYNGQQHGRSDRAFQFRDRDFSVMPAPIKWNGQWTSEFMDSVYERIFTPPDNWAGRHITLRLDDFGSERGRLFVNGAFIAEIAGEHPHEIPIPAERLRFGEPNAIGLTLKGGRGGYAVRGLKANVLLEASPDIVASHPHIVTSTADHTWTVRATLENRSAEARTVILRAAVRDVPDAAALATPPLVLQYGERRDVELSGPWKNPRLWSPASPVLHTAELSVVDEREALLDQPPPIEFGFRSFAIQGKDYRLNGHPVRLFNSDSFPNIICTEAELTRTVRALKALGINSVRCPFGLESYDAATLFRVCDREGMMVFVNVNGVSGADIHDWRNPETRARVEAGMAAKVRAWRNHPSIVLWYLSPNMLGYALDFHPLKMADGYRPASRIPRYETTLAGAEMLRRYDDTRPYFLQAGGGFGPVTNANAYFCWWPTAERRAWADEWNRIGDQPLHIIETSFPYWRSLHGMDRRFFNAARALFIAENAARYRGQDAYAALTETETRYQRETRAGQNRLNLQLSCYDYKQFAALWPVRAEMLVESIHAWRAAGISGITLFEEVVNAFEPSRRKFRPQPHDFRRLGWQPDIIHDKHQENADFDKPLPPATAIVRALKPVLVAWSGTEEEPATRAANVFAGTTVRRVLAVNNDSERDRRFTLVVRGSDSVQSGRDIFRHEQPVDIGRGGILKIPVDIPVPPTDRRGLLAVSARLVEDDPADDALEASLSLSVFPAPAPLTVPVVALYDRRGESADDLRAAGIPFVHVAENDLPATHRVLIVGRRALGDDAFFAWARGQRLGQRVADGMAVLVLEQDGGDLARLGLKTMPLDLRRVFKNAPDAFPHDLSDVELSNWHGPSTLVANNPMPSRRDELAFPVQLWRWQTVNTVASTPIRRPTAGHYVSHASGGMDLAYSALLEIPQGRGTLMFCQLELSGRTSREPAAATLLRELVQRLGGREPPAVGGKVFSVEPSLSGALGFAMEPWPTPIPDDATLWIDAPLGKVRATAAVDAARRGATLIMTYPDEDLLAGLDCRAGPAVTQSLRAIDDKKTPSPRDLYFAEPLPYRVVEGDGVTYDTEPGAIGRLTVGRGTAIFLLFDETTLRARLDETYAVSQEISDYWAQHVMLERWRAIQANALAGTPAGRAMAPNFAGRLETPLGRAERIAVEGAWHFRFDPEDRGTADQWFRADAETSGDWTTLEVPGQWQNQPVAPKFQREGCQRAWYARTVTLPASMRGRALTLYLGAIDDLDETYVNGEKIGATGIETPGYWSAPRHYPIPRALTTDGVLRIFVRVENLRGASGIMGSPAILRDGPDATPDGVFPYDERTFPTYHTETYTRW